MPTIHRKLGFSLIELLVVISIIGLLVAAGTVSWTNAQQKGRDGRRKNDLKAIQQAFELYFQNNGRYPLSLGATRSDWSFVGNSPCTTAWGHSGSHGTNCGTDPNTDLRAALLPFISKIPVDPINVDTASASNLGYYYLVPANGLTYELMANLENNNDPDRNGFWAGFADYKVTNP